MAKSKADWSKLAPELENMARENLKLPTTERLTNKEMFKIFTGKHPELSLSAVHAYFYANTKKSLEEEKEKHLDKKITEFIENAKVDDHIKDPRNTLKIGSIVEANVTSILDFGVFARTDEGFEGLVHISEITREYVTMPEDYFYPDERIKVKVLRITPDGKISFSTRAVSGGKKKLERDEDGNVITDHQQSDNNTSEVAHEAKQKLFAVTKDMEKAKESIQVPTQEKIISTEIPKKSKVFVSEEEKANIIHFIKKYSDTVSKEALVDIDEMVSTYGVFQTTMSLVEAVSDLDISSFITKLTKEKLKEDYLRRNTI